VIGGGVGTGYPEWARREHIARRLADGGRDGPEALRDFLRLHSPEMLGGWARAAGIPEFEVKGETEPLPDGTQAPLGFWLGFVKQVAEADRADGSGRTRPE